MACRWEGDRCLEHIRAGVGLVLSEKEIVSVLYNMKSKNFNIQIESNNAY